jgi:hypothetical protein
LVFKLIARFSYPLRAITLRGTALLLMAVSLASCQMGSSIKIATVDDLTIFSISVDGDKSICIKGISVDEKRGDKLIRLWSLLHDDDKVDGGQKSCDNIFIYGRTHKGFAQSFESTPLKPGKTYLVEYSGTGFGGSKEFVVTQ